MTHALVMLPCGSGMYNFKSARVMVQRYVPHHDTGVPGRLSGVRFVRAFRRCTAVADQT